VNAARTGGAPAVDETADRPLLEVSHLSITAPGRDSRRTLVRDVSLTVRPNETIGIVGESGSGKSLTARAIVGLLPPGLEAAGELHVLGVDPLTAPSRRMRALRGTGVSMLLQDPFTMLSPVRRCSRHIEETLALAADRRLTRQQRHRLSAERLAEVGLTPSDGEKYPFEVSGGMAQRIGLAAALAGDPQLLIADEPSTALDMTTQQAVLELLRRLQQQREMGLILITHDLRVAFSVCDKVYVLYAGSLLEVGSATEISRAPRHPYTHGLLRAEPDVDHRRRALVPLQGSVPAPDDVADRCAFAPRCGFVTDACLAGRPPLRVLADGRVTACVRSEELAAELAIELDAAQPDQPAVPAAPAEADGALLSVQDLRKTFGEGQDAVQVLDGVDLQVTPGESVGLVGESGSGKTTLARCVLGLESASGGSIVFDGVDITDQRALRIEERTRVRRGIQIVFQNPYASLNPARRIGSILAEAAEMAGDGHPDRSTVPALLERVGLPASYMPRRPAGLSGGERQRVAIARALAVRPRLIVCDESVSALDVSVQAQILTLFAELQRELGLALLFITHDLGVVRQVTDRIYVLADGHLVEHGATAEVLDHPSHPYTQRLLASVPRTVAEPRDSNGSTPQPLATERP
jgi:peptide/nickel transport system ATP-binding protein